VVEKCKSILENNIFMFQPILVLLHIEPQAHAKHDFDFQPTDRQYFFIFPAFFGSLL